MMKVFENGREYEIVKCFECGQDRRGPRIIRLRPEHIEELEGIVREYTFALLMYVCVLLLMVAGIIMMAFGFTEESAFPIAGPGVVLLVVALLGIIFSIYGVVMLYAKKRRFLENHYCLGKNERYKIV